MTYRKNLIEAALPLETINEASAREKSIRLSAMLNMSEEPN